jgi:hypothetical protein
MSNWSIDLVSEIHEIQLHHNEDVFYPPHPPRHVTPEYKQAHDRLVHEMKLPCLVCGVTIETVHDAKRNPYQARQLETHHHVVEWALAHALDLGKFNVRIVAQHRARPHHDPIYDQPFTQAQMEAWVDHHPDNLWVLCDVHHRHKFLGIHTISGPIWGVQDLLGPGYGPQVPGPERGE